MSRELAPKTRWRFARDMRFQVVDSETRREFLQRPQNANLGEFAYGKCSKHPRRASRARLQQWRREQNSVARPTVDSRRQRCYSLTHHKFASVHSSDLAPQHLPLLSWTAVYNFLLAWQATTGIRVSLREFTRFSNVGLFFQVVPAASEQRNRVCFPSSELQRGPLENATEKHTRSVSRPFFRRLRAPAADGRPFPL